MRYTHIGLEDQAKALANLRVPKAPKSKTKKAEKQSWQRYGSGTRRSPSQSTSSSGTDDNGEDEPELNKNPRHSEGYVIKRQPESSSGTQLDKWRRRESNPNLIRCNELQHNDLRKVDSGQSAYIQHTIGSTGHELAFADATLERLIAVWSALPRHIQQTIVTLLDAAT